MRDEGYGPQHIPDYGLRAQPALVERMAPQLRLTQVGTVAAAVAVVLAVVAVLTYPDFTGTSPGSGWALAAAIAAVVLLGLCVVQLVAWRRALAEWRGERNHDLKRLTQLSFLAHLVSYAAVLVGLWAAIAGSVAAGTTSTAASLLGFALLFLVLGQVLAAVQYLRVEGPSGTIPGHLRRLAAEIKRRR
jgi:uncharacterized membrane protein